jgi:hypothetical protein
MHLGYNPFGGDYLPRWTSFLRFESMLSRHKKAGLRLVIDAAPQDDVEPTTVKWVQTRWRMHR